MVVEFIIYSKDVKSIKKEWKKFDNCDTIKEAIDTKELLESELLTYDFKIERRAV